MPTRQPTWPAPALLTGHYAEGVGYHTRRPQGTADHLLILTLAGAGRFGGSGGHCTGPGELTLLRPGTPHDYGTDPEAGHWELRWVHFSPRPHWPVWLTWPEVAPGVQGWRLEPNEAEELAGVLRQVHALATGGRPHREAWALHALEQVWLACLPDQQLGQLDPRVLRAMAHLRAHLVQPLRPDTLAKACQLSLSRLRHLFAEQTGQSLLRFWKPNGWAAPHSC